MHTMKGDRPQKHEVPSWDYIYRLCVQVVDQIKKSKFKPDLIVAIARGGWIPGRILSDMLENPSIATIRVEHYVDIYKTISKPKITQPIPMDVEGKKILLVDDIADSGKSLKMVRDHLLDQGAADVKICALYKKPWSIVTPDYVAKSTDAWIWFPHERFETMKKIYVKLREDGKTRDEIRKELIKIGVQQELVNKFFAWSARTR